MIEPGLWALDRLDARGVTVLNPRRALVAAHDKLTTAEMLFAARVPHPRTVHVAPWLPEPELEPPLVLKPRFGSWGPDVVRCDDAASRSQRALETIRERTWFEATGAVAQKLVAAAAATTCGWSSPAARSSARSAASRRPANGGRTSRSARGESRSTRRATPGRSRSPQLLRVGGDLVGVDLLPAGLGSWVVLEVNGAVDFNSTYSLDDDVFAETRRALLFRPASVRVEPAA